VGNKFAGFVGQQGSLSHGNVHRWVANFSCTE
jgi:hypothetical protein